VTVTAVSLVTIVALIEGAPSFIIEGLVVALWVVIITTVSKWCDHEAAAYRVEG
jgi:hypothetical protein